MIALTIRQPFADRVIRGIKTVENRSRSTQVRGQFLVHAAGQMHGGIRTAEVPEVLPWTRAEARLPRRAVVGAVQLVDVHNAETCGEDCLAGGGLHASDARRNDMRAMFHWVLRDPIRFVTEIPRVNGALGFWAPDARVLDLAAAAIAEARP